MAQPLTPQECWRQLTLGVGSIFRQWTVLRLAVENNWGEGDSNRKLELMQEQLLPLFRKQKPPEKEDIEDYLEDFLEENFSTVAEDGSLQEVASIILEMFQKCGVQDLSLVNRVLEREQQMLPSSQLAQKGGAAAGEEDSDSDSDEDMGEGGGGGGGPSPLAPLREGEVKEENVDSMADADDGWETVSTKAPRRSARIKALQK
mmetsp:Transcript_27419/g.43164  ORF Transcript_27419/g.43164 Transcript_27419/m.43164 type:complete len:203 (-) Transcript_27419:34-642(-)